MREKDGSDREEEEEREAIKGRSGALSHGEASPSKADLARRAVVRRGHPEATTKLGTAVVNGGGSRRGEPSPSLYVSSLFA